MIKNICKNWKIYDTLEKKNTLINYQGVLEIHENCMLGGLWELVINETINHFILSRHRFSSNNLLGKYG